jgi:hypothetical protein
MKPKVYTGGTFQYGFLASFEEPLNHLAALNDTRWKLAMDHEFEALLRNRTWHCIRKGPMLLTISGCIR